MNVCADGRQRRTKMSERIVAELCPGAKAPNLKQYPLERHAKEDTKPLITTFLKYQLIRLCQYPYDTPILPIQNPGTGDYNFVQDLRAINQIVEDIYPLLPDPYTLLTTLSGDFC